ncbi:MAG: S41 family peptidase, partial [Bacteroidota bacterium]
MRPRTLRMWAVIGILLMMAALIAGLTTGTAKRYQELDQAVQIMAHVKLRFVEPVSAADLFSAYLRTGTIDGMLASLHDPYTRFLPPAEYRELKVQTDGSFGGIGVILSYNEKDKSILIMKALNGSPGEKAGLRRGDRLVEIDGRAAKGMSVEEAVASIRGPIGSTVRLAVSRGEGESARVVKVTIVRANIKLPSVEWEFLDDPVAGRVALIALAQFSERTPAELDEALRAADEKRARGIILDLRYNPGGLLESAIGVASRFLDGGVVMYML